MLAFAALADETRRQIVETLGERERSVSELVARFSISQPAVSQHLKVLRDAGLVRVRPLAQRRLYSLDPAGVGQIESWLDRHVRRTAAPPPGSTPWSGASTKPRRATMAEANDGLITRCYTVKFVRRSKHSAARLWRAITQPDEIEGWMSYPAQVELRPGGDWRVDFSSTDEGELDGVIVRVEPERRLTYVWGWSVVEWLVEDTPGTGGCTYTFVQNGLADRGVDQDEEGLAAGWHDFLDNLDAHLDGRAQGNDQRKDHWLALKPRYREQLDRVVRA